MELQPLPADAHPNLAHTVQVQTTQGPNPSLFMAGVLLVCGVCGWLLYLGRR